MPDLSPVAERELAAVDDALAGRRVDPDLAGLAELALLLRDDRPEPAPAFTHDLDRRARLGFPAGGSRGGRRWISWRPRWHGWLAPALGFAATAVVFVALVSSLPSGSDDSGGASGGSTSSLDSGAAAPRAESAQSAGGGDAAGDSAAEPSTTLASPVPPPAGDGSPRSDGRDRRKVERSASLTLATKPGDVDAVSARIQDVTRRQGGFVASSSVSSQQGGDFELRIPTRNLDAAMAALSRLGAVRDRQQRSEDITAQSVSARSRLRDARTERKSLLDQLADADTVTEAGAIRARLRLVSNEIEVAKAAVRRVDNRADFATVSVALVADRDAGAAAATEDDGWTPGDAARDALRVLEVAAGVAVIALAVALPVALVAILAGLALRTGRRRRRDHALDAL